jgi:hypothetical protein
VESLVRTRTRSPSVRDAEPLRAGVVPSREMDLEDYGNEPGEWRLHLFNDTVKRFDTASPGNSLPSGVQPFAVDSDVRAGGADPRKETSRRQRGEYLTLQ